ncbi:MAG: DUF4288 domain-containing protein [bacterium]|nr:DUF4288 domain-containing protein [bacterium]
MLWTISILLKQVGDGNISEPIWEENIFLINAMDSDEAKKKAETYGKQLENSYTSATGKKVHWVYDSILSLYQIETETVENGSVVFARHFISSEVESLKESFSD